MIPGFGLIVCPDGSPLNIQLFVDEPIQTGGGYYLFNLRVICSKIWPSNYLMYFNFIDRNGSVSQYPFDSKIDDYTLTGHLSILNPEGTFGFQITQSNIPQTVKDNTPAGCAIIEPSLIQFNY